MPTPTNVTPTKNTVNPAIQLGKTLRNTFVGRKEMTTTLHAQTKFVPGIVKPGHSARPSAGLSMAELCGWAGLVGAQAWAKIAQATVAELAE